MEAGLLAEVAHLATRDRDLQGLTQPMLELVQRVTGLESTYLTQVDWEEDVQEMVTS